MRVQGVGKNQVLPSLLEVGFQPLPENNQIFHYAYESQGGMLINWFWMDSNIKFDESHDFTGITIKLRKNRNTIEIELQSDFLESSFQLNLKHETRLIVSLIQYFKIFDIQLDAKTINQTFGRDSFFHQLAMHSLEIDPEEITKWREIYKNLYDERILDENLYLSHKYFFLLLRIFLFKSWNSSNSYKITYEEILDHYPNIRISNESRRILFSKTIQNSDLLQMFQILIPTLEFKSEELFSDIFQSLISLDTRHPLGEVYTPVNLIQKMLMKKITNQSSFLDPSCGTGMFLVEIVLHLLKKGQLQNTTKIFGIDINPLSIEAALTNMLILLKNMDSNYYPEVYFFHEDALLLNKNSLLNDSGLSILKTEKVDFIIGNPPWINISGIYQRKYKEKLKSLARQLHILYNAESKNTEISTIFFVKVKEEYLKNGGEIFFILPASVLNGRQHGYFRYFPDCTNIEVWRFSEDIFKVHSICLYAKNQIINEDLENKNEILKRLTLLGTNYAVLKNGELSEMNRNEKLVPIYIKAIKKSHFPLVGKYNLLSSIPKPLQNITPEKSPYYKKVRGGLRIVPRRWVVIKEKPPFEESVFIHPDMKQQAKPQWADPPYSQKEVESEYIHAFLKSSFLIPYSFVEVNYAFIPTQTSKNSLKRGEVIPYSTLKPKAHKLYQLLDKEYRNRIKPSASMKTLADNFTYNNRLLPTNILMNDSHVMVVHNSIGSIVKSAIIRSPILLDNSLYYILLNNITEAHYLCGVLNSRVITDLVRMIGSTGSRGSLRNIHKNPYNFAIPAFSGNSLQMKISHLAKNMEEYVHSLLFSSPLSQTSNLIETIKTKKMEKGPRSIQKVIFHDSQYTSQLTKLNTLVKELLD